MTCLQDLSHQHLGRPKGTVMVEEAPEIVAADLGDQCSLQASQERIVASYPVVPN